MIANPLPTLTILGVAFYAVLRLAYVFFYLRLRTTPEEVGFGYTQILSQSAIGTLELTLILFVGLAVVGAVVVAVAKLGTALTRKAFRPGGCDGRKSGSLPGQVALRVWGFRAFAVAFFVVLVGLPWIAWWQGGLAADGQTVRNIYFIAVPRLPVLGVQAIPARVSWIDDGPSTRIDLAGRDCLMYLGRADGVAMFYDVLSRESLRVPAGNVVVSLEYAFFVPPECRLN